MNQKRWLSTIIILLLAVGITLAIHPHSVQALPEYSAQTGEPCASCHVSPSGGGPRGPRGQAWVGDGKPGTVPDLIQALELLGIDLDIDESRFQPPVEPPPAAEPPAALADDEAGTHLRWHLKRFDGN